MTRHRIASVFAILISCSTCSLAQFDGGMMAGYGGAMATVGLNAMNTQMLLGTMPSSSVTAANSKRTNKPIAHTLTQVDIQAAATDRSLSKLASVYPEQHRGKVVATMRQLLDGFHKIEQQFAIPRNDMAGAIAGFLAGSYMAYQDTEFPDENFKPLVNQMRQIVSSNPDFAKASSAEKQEMYEQMAVLGMFMATTQMALKENPNPQVAANMKQAAKGYLEQFLKTDANKVFLTANGLEIR